MDNERDDAPLVDDDPVGGWIWVICAFVSLMAAIVGVVCKAAGEC